MLKFFSQTIVSLSMVGLALSAFAIPVHAQANQQQIQSQYQTASGLLSQMDTLRSEITALVDEVAQAGTPTTAKPKADQVISKSEETVAKAQSMAQALNQIAAELKKTDGAESQKGAQLEQTVDAAGLVFSGAQTKISQAKAIFDQQGALTQGDIETAANTAYEAVNTAVNMASDLIQGASTLAGIDTQETQPGQTSVATQAPQGQTFELENPLKTTSIPIILGNVISMFLGVVGALALVAFVYGGIMYMTARGNTDQVKKAVDTVKSAVIGLLIIAFSYTITNSFIKLWTEQPITASTNRAPATGLTTQSQEEAQQLQTTVQQQAEAEAAAQSAGAAEAGQTAASQKAWAEQQGCNALIKQADPSDTNNYSCMNLSNLDSAYLCLTLSPSPCGTGEACCTK